MGTDVDTIVISDLHLGSPVSRADKALAMLKAHTFKRLILNGDIIDRPHRRRLTSAHLDFLSYLRTLAARTDPKTEIIWLEGNHDAAYRDEGRAAGFIAAKEFAWEHGGVRYLALHGHQFDRPWTNHPLVHRPTTWLFDTFQRMDPNLRVSRFIKKKTKKITGCAKAVAAGALGYAPEKNAHVVLCGHTHEASERIDTRQGIRYLNSGSWTDDPCTYIAVGDNGAELRAWPS
ncbi:MAG TPA: UDP-2,3-diacylglucosamine diphosphatase [Candidatus Paceibacterota bacterium]|nr:UDP-2,3-diacylglucosamine diphosphatase [Candidatus Paceibacterota bacterium]